MNFLTDKIRPIYFKYLAAAFGSALITSIYGVVDAAMVGQYQGPTGTAALAVVAPVWNIIYSLGLLTGIGGSVRAAAKMHAQAAGATARPKTMTKKEIHAILEWCRTDPDAFAHTALKASAERVHTLVPGCIILLELLDACGADRLDVCKYGVREGYLIDRMLR